MPRRSTAEQSRPGGIAVRRQRPSEQQSANANAEAADGGSRRSCELTPSAPRRNCSRYEASRPASIATIHQADCRKKVIVAVGETHDQHTAEPRPPASRADKKGPQPRGDPETYAEANVEDEVVHVLVRYGALSS